MATALYRRYRPESFSEMIGQSQVTDPLMTALRTGRVGHAYLFSGPRGCGKTTSARILARCLNCAEGPTDTPCGTCPSCVELSRSGGGSLDVVEIDAASHGGVDDARDLRERAVFAPARDRFKIFIIDEAHMVTAGGFNALLKIVEEPPPHVKFIFATTEPEKVIGTIRSRTHHYPFRLIPPATLTDYVQTLCDSEGVAVEPGVLPLVVRSGGGSVRDTLSILDQLIAGSEGNQVSADRAAGLLGFTHTELLDDVVAALGARDSAAAFTATDRVVQTGQDPRRFVEDLLERLRDLIIVNATSIDGAAAVLRGVPQDQLTRMFEQARTFGARELSRTADTVSEALDQMTGATPPRLHLELMIARAIVGLTGDSAKVAAPAEAAGTAAPMQPSAQRAAQPSAPAQPAIPHTSAAQPAPAAEQQRVAGAAKAAQTAASIRDFLRNDDAGTTPAAPIAAPVQPSSDRQAPHPNEGAAGFGRPISDVLSASQIESIGTEPVRPAPQTAATPAAPLTSISAAPTTATSEAPAAATSQYHQDPPAEAPKTDAAPIPATGQPANVHGSQPQSVNTAPEDDTAHDDGLPGFEDLREMWADLLDELLETDRAAWNAVKVVDPLGLDGDVLTVGISNRSDLEQFKSAGAGPLRETILSATGLSVRYVPKHVASTGTSQREQTGQNGHAPANGAPVQGSADASEPDQRGTAEHLNAHPAAPPVAQPDTEPHTAPSAVPNVEPSVTAQAASRPQHDSNDPMERASARLNALGPALAAPAWADPAHPAATPVTATPVAPASVAAAPQTPQDPPATAPAPAATTVPTPATQQPVVQQQHRQTSEAYEPEPLDSYDYGADDDPYAGMHHGGNAPADSQVSAQSAPTAPPEQPAAPAAQPESVAQQPAEPIRPVSQEKPAPAFTRYGESVVREVLGAVFLEERPLPESRR